MIYDTLNNLPNYLGMSENLDTVIEYVMARDINTLPAGKTRIDGDNVLVTVSTVTPQVSEKAPFVRHDAHLTLETSPGAGSRSVSAASGGCGHGNCRSRPAR